MRPKRETWAFLALSAAWSFYAPGCMLFRPLDELSSEIGSSDAAVDGNAGEVGANPDGGGPLLDGGTNDGANGDAAPAPFCASQSPKPEFCDDFDDAPAPWAGDVVTGPSAGTVQIVNLASAPSPPSVLYTKLEPSAPGCSYAGKIAKLTGFPRNVRATAKFRQPYLATSLPALVLYIGQGSDRCSVMLVTATGKVSVYEQILPGTSEDRHDSTIVLPENEWSSVTFDVDWDAKHFVVKTGDGAKAEGNLTYSCPLTNVPVYLQVGRFCENPSSVVRETYYDDVTFDPL